MNKNEILFKLPFEKLPLMKAFYKHIYLIILLLIPNINFGQHNSFASDSIRSMELRRKAIQYYQKGLHTQALDTFFLSLELRKKLYGESSPNLALVYMGIGIIYKNLGQLNVALRYYKLAESNFLLAKDYPYLQITDLYENMGTVYRNKLDFSKALQFYEQALSISTNQINDTREEIAGINYNIAEIYYLTNNFDKAISIINDNIGYAYAEDQILFYELLAFIYQIQGNFTKSRKNYLKAIDLTIVINEGNPINIALEYINYSNFLISNNQFNEAEETLKKSLHYIELTKPSDNSVLTLYFKTMGYLANNRFVSSENLESFKKQKKQNLNEAVSWFKKGLVALNFPENYTMETINESSKWLSVMECIDLLKLIADNYNEQVSIEQSKENPFLTPSMSQAIFNYQLVGALIQKTRTELTDDRSKIQLTSFEYSTFQKIVKISYSAYSITRDPKYLELAFLNAERVKSSSIFDKISDELAMENSLIPDSLANLEKKYNTNIAIFTGKLNQERSSANPDSMLINEYNNEIFEATRNREELKSYLESKYKDYYELKYSNTMLSAKQIQQKLKADQIIIEYVLNEEDTIPELYAFVISQSGVDFFKQEIDSDFVQSIENVFHFMSNTEYMFTKNEDSKKFCLSSNQLYKSLILPFLDHIQNKKITIIPDGKLSYIPFDALLEDLPDTTKRIEFNQLNYLIRNYSINYSNSANLLFKQISKSKKTRIKAVAFAPEYKVGQTIEIANKRYSLVPLPGVKREVEEISKILNTEIFSGENASENNFRKNVEKYDILHLAMHAFIDDSLPAYSCLAFTQNNSGDLSDNGLLSTTDIYNFNLNARLVVLSACNTGTGLLKKGEGIMSLARGFLYAGCPSIVMSLWEVEDESGTQLMTSFYKNIKKGKTKDEALRLAKLEYLNSVNSRRAHPHYWLGFVTIGDNSPLYLSYDFYFFILLILALSGIGIDQLVRIKKARKKRAF